MTIKEIRERLGKTQAEMAEMLGISRNYLALMEIGKRNESPDIVNKALQIVDSAGQQISAEEWKARALAAESKLSALKLAVRELLDKC